MRLSRKLHFRQLGTLSYGAEMPPGRAPSVLHVPRVTVKFLAGELLLRRSRLSRARWNHVIACVISPAIGLGRRWFGYYLITARKRDHRHALVE